MATFISRLVLVCTLSLPAFSSAITIQGNIHPERYTFFLTEKGGEMLRDMNNEAVNVKHSGKASASVDAQNKAAAANISPLLYPGAPLEQNFIRYDGKPVKTLTCLIPPAPCRAKIKTMHGRKLTAWMKLVQPTLALKAGRLVLFSVRAVQWALLTALFT